MRDTPRYRKDDLHRQALLIRFRDLRHAQQRGMISRGHRARECVHHIVSREIRRRVSPKSQLDDLPRSWDRNGPGVTAAPHDPRGISSRTPSVSARSTPRNTPPGASPVSCPGVLYSVQTSPPRGSSAGSRTSAGKAAARCTACSARLPVRRSCNPAHNAKGRERHSTCGRAAAPRAPSGHMSAHPRDGRAGRWEYRSARSPPAADRRTAHRYPAEPRRHRSRSRPAPP
jgi:hypothetical protein